MRLSISTAQEYNWQIASRFEDCLSIDWSDAVAAAPIHPNRLSLRSADGHARRRLSPFHVLQCRSRNAVGLFKALDVAGVRAVETCQQLRLPPELDQRLHIPGECRRKHLDRARLPDSNLCRGSATTSPISPQSKSPAIVSPRRSFSAKRAPSSRMAGFIRVQRPVHCRDNGTFPLHARSM